MQHSSAPSGCPAAAAAAAPAEDHDPQLEENVFITKLKDQDEEPIKSGISSSVVIKTQFFNLLTFIDSLSLKIKMEIVTI